MRLFKISLIAAMAVIIGLTSCSRDDKSVIEPDGEKAYIEVSLNFPKDVTSRGTSDDNATDAEAAIKGVDIFLYNASGIYLSHKNMDASDFSSTTGGTGADKYTSTIKIPTTTGVKSVLAGVNLPATVVTALTKGLSINQLQTEGLAMTFEESANLSEGLPMFSVEPVKKEVKADVNDNKFEITVQRFVSKIVVQKADGMGQKGVAGKLGNLEFAVSNYNLRAFMLPNAEGKDPNWSDPEYDVNEFHSATSENYKVVHDLANNSNVDMKSFEACYAMENSSENKRIKEITRATVRAKFVPAVAHKWDEGNLTEIDNSNGSDASDYWAVTPAVGETTKFFYTESEAIDYAEANSTSAIKFSDSYHYWAIYLNEKGENSFGGTGDYQWDNFRNQLFVCTIGAIVLPGNNEDNPKDPEIKPSENTNITVDINIKHWETPIESDHILDQW